MSSIYHGKNFSLSVFGQSHAEAIGMTLDGLPAGIPVDLDTLQRFLDRRAPGRNNWSTARKEADVPEFVCGLKDGRTCGAPLTALIRNTNTRPQDYDTLKNTPRPGHADYPAAVKHQGFQDAAGGGHFSGRLTAPLCVAGGILLQELERRGITVRARIAAIAGIRDDSDFSEPVADKDFPVTDDACGLEMRSAIAAAQADEDSVGGIIECIVDGLPAGFGAPMFDGVENCLARLIFAIPAVRGIEFGAGFEAAVMRGSEHNDAYVVEDGQITTATNHAGGVLGGLTTGMPLEFRVAFKPTPSIARPQQTVNLETMEPATLEVRGRHDPCIVPRAVPVVEAVAAIAVYDLLEGA